MKIFLSYGHDHNRPVVECVERDLKAAGHEVWKDDSAIKAGDDWRRGILDGVKGSDLTLGFLSKHSVREPGVCLDELGIALHEKGGAIATVLLEAEVMASPPVSVSHIQWLDMHEWADRKAAGEAAFEAWYAPKLQQLKELLADPQVQRFAGEIEELQKHLTPAAQTADIARHVDGFVGREWLLERLKGWRTAERDSRLLWLSGGTGTGKSAFAAWIAHKGKVDVLALNLCKYNEPDRRNADRVLRTLAFQLATRLPDYRRLLLDALKREPTDAVASKGPADLFRWLLVEPLRRVIDGGRRENRFVVVVDGLDETFDDNRRSDLAEVIAAQARDLPDWIALVVTSRPEDPIKQLFAEFHPVQIDAESVENMVDVRDYIRKRLPDVPGMTTARAGTLVEPIVAASEGNFLYLDKFFEEVTKKGSRILDLATPADLPRGLVGLYARWFLRHFPDREAYKTYRPTLEIIAAAEHPVPEDWLARLLGWSSIYQRREMLQGLPSLFERRPSGVTPFHKSLRDWMIDAREEKAGAYFVDQTEGRRLLANGLWDVFLQWVDKPGATPLDPFCIAELPLQAIRLSDADLHRLTVLRPWDTLAPALFTVARARAAAYEWQDAIAWWRLAAVASALDGEGDPWASYAHDEVGDIHMTIGNLPEALTSFRAGLAIAERLATADPGNAGWQRDLSVSYNKIGDVQVGQGNLPEALTSFRAGLAIAERLATADPGNAGWQRDVIVSCVKIAEMSEGEARPLLMRALEVASRLRETGRLRPVDAWIPGELARRLAALDG